MSCTLCGSSDHSLSQCPWKGKGDAMPLVLLVCGLVLSAIGIRETVRGWQAGDSGLAQGLGGVTVAMLGGWMVLVSVLKVAA
jgi:hypothetical protein